MSKTTPTDSQFEEWKAEAAHGIVAIIEDEDITGEYTDYTLPDAKNMAVVELASAITRGSWVKITIWDVEERKIYLQAENFFSPPSEEEQELGH